MDIISHYVKSEVSITNGVVVIDIHEDKNIKKIWLKDGEYRPYMTY